METDFPEGESRDAHAHARRRRRRSRWRCAGPAWAGEGFAVKVNGEDGQGPARAAPAVRRARPHLEGRRHRVRSRCPRRCASSRRRTTRAARRSSGGRWCSPATWARAGARGREERHARPAPPAPPLLVAAERPVTEWVKPVAGPPGRVPDRRRRRGPRRAARALLPAPPPRVCRLLRPVHARRVGQGGRGGVGRAGARNGSSSARRWPTSARRRPGRARLQPCRARSTSLFVEPISGRRGRRGRKWFSFDLPVDPAQPLTLVVTYHTDQPRARSFEILVDGAARRRADASRQRGGAVPRRGVPVADALVEGKQKVTVRFQATQGREIAPVFGVRVVRAP